MSITTSPGSGSRRCIENDASEELALCAAQAFAALVFVEVVKDSVLVDMIVVFLRRGDNFLILREIPSFMKPPFQLSLKCWTNL
jgi:hypothetical protein